MKSAISESTGRYELTSDRAYTFLSAFTLLDKKLAITDTTYNQSMVIIFNP